MSLNRKQRRQVAKQKLTAEDIKILQKQEGKEATAFAVNAYSAAMALCLHDKLGFGPVRAQRFMKQVEELFDSINQGYLSVEDVIKTVETDLGIQIKD
jgi:hypothetical protein